MLYCEQAETLLPLLALDELEPERQAELESHLSDCAACREKLADLRATVSLITEAAARLPEPRLSEERRQALEQAASKPVAKALAGQPHGRIISWMRRTVKPGHIVRIAAALLICAIVGGMLLPALSSAREKSRRVACLSNLGQIVKAETSWQEPNGDFFPQSDVNQNRSVVGKALGPVPAEVSGHKIYGDMDGSYSHFRDKGPSYGYPAGGERSSSVSSKSDVRLEDAIGASPRKDTEYKPFLGGNRRFSNQEMLKGRAVVSDNFRGDTSGPDAGGMGVVRDRGADTSDLSIGGGGGGGGGDFGISALTDGRDTAKLYPFYSEKARVFRAPSTENEPTIVAKAPAGEEKWTRYPGQASEGGQNVLYFDANVKWMDTKYASDDPKDNIFAPTSGGTKDSGTKSENGQNVLYVDGHVKWMDNAYASNDPKDNILAPVGGVAGKRGEGNATDKWGVDVDAYIWDGQNGRVESDKKAAVVNDTRAEERTSDEDVRSAKGGVVYRADADHQTVRPNGNAEAQKETLKLAIEARPGFSREAKEEPKQSVAFGFSEWKKKEDKNGSISVVVSAPNVEVTNGVAQKLEIASQQPVKPEIRLDSVHGLAAKELMKDAAEVANQEEFKEVSKDVKSWAPNVDSFVVLSPQDENGKQYQQYRDLKSQSEAREKVPAETSAATNTEVAAELPKQEPEVTRPAFRAGPVNPWVMVEKDALSTFGIDVDTASYAIARNYIMRGKLPPAASVRMEEYVNAFDYNYPTQSSGVFSVHAEAGPSPFGQGLTLLKVGVRAKVLGRESRKPAHLVFVVDASGSMERADRLPLVKYALKSLVEQLAPQDRVSLVAFGTRAMLTLENVPATEKGRIVSGIDSLRCGGSTNLFEGLKTGYELAARTFQTGGINRVILCSDGVANVGSTEADAMLTQVESLRKQGVTLTTVGFGFGGYDDVLLERLANRGDGSYVFVDGQAEARRVFVQEMAATLQTVAEDAKIQVAFDPARVRRYRLIGFENRDIADADFRNDTVDAGEVGSGQSSTALYELELVSIDEYAPGSNAFGTVFVRYRDNETRQIEEIATPLRREIVRGVTPKSSPRFFLAACAAEFAEILRQSEHSKDGSLAGVRGILEQVAGELPLDLRVQEFLELVRRSDGLPRAE